MNYYEHHLGDYMRDTAHLSMLEDGAYRRLLDAYYIKEAPIPLDARDACRLVRAQSKPERDAVAVVLKEFFQQEQDGWHHRRCDREIARFQDKRTKARNSAAARWGALPPQSEGNANASPDAMRTHSEGNATHGHAGARAPARPQTPVTSHQSPGESAGALSTRTPAAEACLRMKSAGLQAVNPGHPKLLALLQTGMTVDELESAAVDAVKAGKPFAYALATAEGRRRDAASSPLPAQKADWTAGAL